MITSVPNEYLSMVWDSAGPLLEKIEEHSSENYTAKEIFNAILRGEQQLWIYIENKDEMIGAWTTRVFEVPGKRIVEICSIGGNGMNRDRVEEVLVSMENFGKNHGCSMAQITGRRGWKRVLSPFGYEERSVVLEKEIDHG